MKCIGVNISDLVLWTQYLFFSSCSWSQASEADTDQHSYVECNHIFSLCFVCDHPSDQHCTSVSLLLPASHLLFLLSFNLLSQVDCMTIFISNELWNNFACWYSLLVWPTCFGMPFQQIVWKSNGNLDVSHSCWPANFRSVQMIVCLYFCVLHLKSPIFLKID
jgi:hypothetical protein